MSRCALACACLLLWWTAASAQEASYYYMFGSTVRQSAYPPMVTESGTTYVALDLLAADFAGPLPTAGQDEQPISHYDPAEGGADGMQPDEASTRTVAAAPAPAPVALKPGYQRFRIGGHVLDRNLSSASAMLELDGQPVATGAALRHRGRDYLAAAELDRVGLHLTFNGLEDCYQLVGLIHRVEYQRTPPALVLGCLTPIKLEGVQLENSEIRLDIAGGFLGQISAQEYAADQFISKIGFRSQADRGRSFIYIHQPAPSGFKIVKDPHLGFARVKFGNYVRVGQPNLSSSGELSLSVDVATPTQVRHEYLPDPPRVFVDFPGTVYDEATFDNLIEFGRVERLRVGKPEPGVTRVVFDLSERSDYRVLSKGDGLRHYVQILPPTPQDISVPPLVEQHGFFEPYQAPPLAPEVARQFRVGRTIMIDPGHGGSDPGAPGVIDGIWEKDVNLAICGYLEDELQKLGYQVLTTRRTDRFVSLGERADYANHELPYLFVSVHANWLEDPEYQGLMTFHHPKSQHGPRFGGLVQQELIQATGAVDKNVRTANFFVLRETAVPAILVETGCLSNRYECGLLSSPAYQRQLAIGIAAGVDRYVTGR